MKVVTIIARVFLGLIFVVFGSNAFLRFLPMPPLPQGVTGEYLHAFLPAAMFTSLAASNSSEGCLC